MSTVSAKLIVVSAKLIVVSAKLIDKNPKFDHPTIMVRHFGDRSETGRYSCCHKQCKTLSKDHSGALREFNYSTHL